MVSRNNISFQRGISSKESVGVGIEYFLNHPQECWELIPAGYYFLISDQPIQESQKRLISISLSDNKIDKEWHVLSYWSHSKKILRDAEHKISINEPEVFLPRNYIDKMIYIGSIEIPYKKIKELAAIINSEINGG